MAIKKYQLRLGLFGAEKEGEHFEVAIMEC